MPRIALEIPQGLYNLLTGLAFLDPDFHGRQPEEYVKDYILDTVKDDLRRSIDHVGDNPLLGDIAAKKKAFGL